MTPYRADYTGQDFRGDYLRNHRFSEVILIDAKMSGASLPKTSFKGSNLTRCQLDSANLEEANFRAANLTEANFKFADLRFADLRDIVSTGADFSFAKMSHSNMRYTDLSEVVFVGAHMDNASLIGAYLDTADLTNAALREADLNGCDLLSANLTNANLTLANLTEANLTGCNLTGVIGLGTKTEEIEFARHALQEIESGNFVLSRCNPYHNIAALAFPETADLDNSDAEPLASRMYPTLARHFRASDEIVLNALREVASGKLSVFG